MTVPSTPELAFVAGILGYPFGNLPQQSSSYRVFMHIAMVIDLRFDPPLPATDPPSQEDLQKVADVLREYAKTRDWGLEAVERVATWLEEGAC